MRTCLSCQININDRHLNAKRCVPCAKRLKDKPEHNLTPAQQHQALSLRGKMTLAEIAARLSVSKTTMKRFAQHEKSDEWNTWGYTEKQIAEVLEYFATHTKVETAKKFPNIRVRSIIERYGSVKKMDFWSEEDILQLQKCFGLLGYGAIGKSLKKSPGAILRKKYRMFSGRLNGLCHSTARHYVSTGCPFYYVLIKGKNEGQWICPWVIMEKYLQQDVPAHLKNAIYAMSKFQKWLHGGEEKIYKVLKGEV